MHRLYICVSALAVILLLLHKSDASVCNEAVCASVVSKCMLTQSCKCDLTHHCSCCRDCFTCLSYLYEQCCSCVDMCPGVTEVASTLSKQSVIEEIPGGVPELFAALTAVPDPQKRWLHVTFPNPLSDLSLQSVEEDTSHILNCTVAYLSQCMSLKKCKSTCESMGSSSFRWFRDGCCECIGETCRKNGSDESRCLDCSNGATSEDEDDDLSEDSLDYGESMEPMDVDSFT